MAISGVGQSYYQNNVATTKSTKSVNSTEETGNTKELSEAEEMAIFKKEFYAEIDKIPRNRTITNVAINISEEAFKNMKDDPEYREKILSALKRDLTSSFAPLEASMVLYFTGASRSSAAIIDQQRKNTSSGNQKAIDAMHRIKQSAIDMKLALLKGDMQAFAKILGQGWEDKKKMAEAISNPMIQEVFDVAIPAGALAGKVSGAGGGGFIMLMVEPTRKKEVINALKELDGFVMPFRFTEGGAHGWKIYSTDKI